MRYALLFLLKLVPSGVALPDDHSPSPVWLPSSIFSPPLSSQSSYLSLDSSYHCLYCSLSSSEIPNSSDSFFSSGSGCICDSIVRYFSPPILFWGLYHQRKEDDPLVVCKFFTPDSSCTWYVIEFDGKDIFFGWVYGYFPGLGYFRLSETEKLRAPTTIRMEGKAIHIREHWPLSEISTLSRGRSLRLSGCTTRLEPLRI